VIIFAVLNSTPVFKRKLLSVFFTGALDVNAVRNG